MQTRDEILKEARVFIQDERWISLTGWEGLYELSDFGRVWSVSRIENVPTRWGGFFNRKRGGYLMKVSPANPKSRYKAYLVGLRRQGAEKQEKFIVSRLVAEAFIGPLPFPSAVVRHKDDDPSNNHYQNLEYGTFAENSLDMVLRGRSGKGSKNPCAVLSESDVLNIVKRLGKLETHRSIAKEFGVHPVTISGIARGRSWSHITGIKIL
jgi:hypothetical protein